MRNKVLSFLLAISLLFVLCPVSPVQSTGETPSAMSVTLLPDENFVVLVQNADNADGVTTFFLTDVDVTGMPAEQIPSHIAYIDQKAADSQGRTEFSFKISSEYANTDLIFASGVTTGTGVKNIIHIPQFPIGIEDIYDNSIRVGADVYHATSEYLSDTDTVIASIKQGGNILYYKIGGLWYDIMKARSSDYFNPANAVPQSVVDSWTLDQWYPELGVEPVDIGAVELQ